MNPRLRIVAFSLGVTLALVAPSSRAQQHTVESVAVEIARQHNANAKALLDEMTVSTSATARGKNVILNYVLKIKRGLPPAKLADLKAETFREIAPRACQVNAQNEAFKKGLYYTFVYHNTYGEKIMEFVINRATCERK